MHLDQSFHFQRKLEDLKRRHLPYDHDNSPILHREDMVNNRGPFYVFQDSSRRETWNQELLLLIEQTQFMIIAVVIDKVTHGTRNYRRVKHPYHYGLEALLERYCLSLNQGSFKGDVMAESRGKKEDLKLKAVYSQIFKFGTSFLNCLPSTLTSREIKIKSKKSNEAGLQLADLLVHPVTRDVLLTHGRIPNRGSPFADRICQTIRGKYRRSSTGKVKGWGQKILD